MPYRESAFKTLERVAEIPSKQDRIVAIRELCTQIPVFAKFIQYTYHPEVEFDLPEGELPKNIFKAASHDEYSTFYQSVRKLPNYFTTSSVQRLRKEMNFIVLCESVCAEDVPLLVGCKDKKLPFRVLSQKFCFQALPELFPVSEDTSSESTDEEENA